MAYSVQLFTVRSALETDLAAAIRRLAEIGITQVEPYRFHERADEFAAAFADNDITAPSGHAPLLSGDQEEIFTAAKRLGIGIVIDPYLPAKHWQDTETIQDSAARLNAAAKQAAAHGLRVGYHNHFWETETKIGDTTALEYFAGLLDPDLVLEVDTYWAAVGGVDPAELITRLGDRVVALHLKDGPIERDTSTQLPVGQGRMDIWGVIAATRSLEVGVLEFDDYAGDIFAGVAASLRYLEAGPAADAKDGDR